MARSRFILPGKHQCLIEALELYNEIISSPASSEISMPGRFTENTSQILMNLLVTKIFEEGIISIFWNHSISVKFTDQKFPKNLEILYCKPCTIQDFSPNFLVRKFFLNVQFLQISGDSPKNLRKLYVYGKFHYHEFRWKMLCFTQCAVYHFRTFDLYFL